MSFQINDKVVCVKNTAIPGKKKRGFSMPRGRVQIGAVYVVCGHFTADDGKLRTCVVGKPIRFWSKGSQDVGWPPYCFRRLEEVQQQNALRQAQPEPALA